MIVDPADLGIDFTLDADLYFKAVAVHLDTLMARRQTGQVVGSLEAEVLGQSRAHDFESPIARELSISYHILT